MIDLLFVAASVPLGGPEKAACARYGSYNPASQQLVSSKYFFIMLTTFYVPALTEQYDYLYTNFLIFIS